MKSLVLEMVFCDKINSVFAGRATILRSVIQDKDMISISSNKEMYLQNNL